MMWQMVVRINGKDYSATSEIDARALAMQSLYQQLQEMITNDIGITPTVTKLMESVTRLTVID